MYHHNEGSHGKESSNWSTSALWQVQVSMAVQELEVCNYNKETLFLPHTHIMVT